MIKNIVFDMGNVLICFDPEKTLRKYTDDENDIKLILDKFYKSELYRDIDRGLKTHSEVIDLISPYLTDSAVRLLKKLYAEECFGRTNMPAADGMYELISELNSNGYGTYLLSNAGYDFYDYSKDIPAISILTGGVVSCDLHLLKPEREIYISLLDKYSLKADECLFIDDLEENAEGARECGMDAICYSSFKDGVDSLRRSLVLKGVNIKECT